MLSQVRERGDSLVVRIGRVVITRTPERVHLHVPTSARRDALLMLALGLPLGGGLAVIPFVVGGATAGLRASCVALGAVVVAACAGLGWRAGRRAVAYELDAARTGDRAVRVRGPDGWTRIERRSLEGFGVVSNVLSLGRSRRFYFPVIRFAGKELPVLDPRAHAVEAPVALVCAVLAALVLDDGDDVAAALARVRRQRRVELAVVGALVAVVAACLVAIALALA